MPLAAVCKRCGYLMIGKNKREIVQEINQHFRDAHNTTPDTDPEVYNTSDKSKNEANPVEYDNSRGGVSTFNSWIFCAEDYCIATIMYDDYNACKREETQKKFSLWRDEYFWGYYEKPDK